MENLSFSQIKIQELSGSQNLEYLNDFDPKSLKAKVSIDDLEFKYENYPKISQKTITATLQNGNVDLNLEANKEFETLSIDADVKSTIDAKLVDGDINIYYKDIDIKTAVDVKDGILEYKISSKRFSSLETIEDFAPLPEGIREWAIVRLKTNGVQIDSVSGEIDMDGFKPDLSSLRVEARAFDIVMDFNPKKAYPLNADVVYITYDGKDLRFDLENPISNDVDLTGSYGVIYNMLGDGNKGLLLQLQSISPLNWTLVRVVQSYGVSIPNDLGLRQVKGNSDIKVMIDISFSNQPFNMSVQIDNEDSTLKIQDRLIDFKTFHFLLKDNKVLIKDTLAKYELYNAHIKDMLFDISNKNLNLELSAYDDNKTFALDLTNKTDLEDKVTNGEIDIEFVDFKNIVSIEDEIIPYSASFGEDVDAKLSTLGIEYKKQKDDHFIKIAELKRFEPFILPMAKAGLERSSLIVNSKAFKDTDIKLYAKGAMDINKSYEIQIDSNVNLDRNTSKGALKIYSLKFDDKVDLNNTDIPYNASFGKEISANLPSLELEYKNRDKIHSLAINSVQKLTSLVKMLDSYPIPQSDINLKTKDFKTMQIALNTDISDYGVFYKKQKKDNLSLLIGIEDMKNISIDEKDKMLKANIVLEEKPIVDLVINDLGIEYFDDSNETNTTKDQVAKKPEPCKYINLDLPKIAVDLNNGYFKYNKNLLNYDNISLDTNDDKVDFILKDKNSSIEAKLDRYDVDLKLQKISTEFVNNIAGLKAISGGYIDLNASGNQCNIDGEIILEDVDIKEAAILNKIFVVVNSTPAFINPFLIIPNVVRFGADGFSLSRYQIDHGEVIFNFNRSTGILDISSVKSLSTHNSFFGDAIIDLNQMSIDSTVEVSFMQGIAKVIDFIPVVGYWVLGDDGRFSYSVDIDGKFSDLDINTKVGKETVLAPVNIVKRIITSPAKLVDYATSGDNNSSE